MRLFDARRDERLVGSHNLTILCNVPKLNLAATRYEHKIERPDSRCQTNQATRTSTTQRYA